MSKNVYQDPWLNNKQNMMKFRADVVEEQCAANGDRSNDLKAAHKALKEKKLYEKQRKKEQKEEFKRLKKSEKSPKK